MNPQKEAESLVLSFMKLKTSNDKYTMLGWAGLHKRTAINCALITVRKIKSLDSITENYDLLKFWTEVEVELNKMF